MGVQSARQPEQEQPSLGEQLRAFERRTAPWCQIAKRLNGTARVVLPPELEEAVTENGTAPVVLPPELEEAVTELITYVRKNHGRTAPIGTELFRARNHPRAIESFSDVSEPFPPNQMGAPPATCATAGRVNPEGVSCLYTAEDKTTAIAEIRPWVDANVTVARLKLTKPLYLADAAEPPLAPLGEGLRWLWQIWISCRCFSRPVQRENDSDYLLGQFVARRLKNAGFDGIRYESAANPSGINVALFDTESPEATSSELYRINAIQCKYDRMER